MSSRLLGVGVLAVWAVHARGRAPAPSVADEAEKMFRAGLEAYEGQKAIDKAQARKLFLRAAAKGHDLAAAYAGWMAYFGEGGPVDVPGGLKLIEKALPTVRKKAES